MIKGVSPRTEPERSAEGAGVGGGIGGFRESEAVTAIAAGVPIGKDLTKSRGANVPHRCLDRASL